jgi:hypothetical protein
MYIMEFMNMPVTVGVIMILMFLVTFSGWFVTLVDGWTHAVLDDKFWKYRLAGAGLMTLVVVALTWNGLMIKENCSQLNVNNRDEICSDIERYEKAWVILATNQRVLPLEEAVDESEFIFSGER